MKHGDFKKKSGGFLLGRELIIIIVVLTTAISFTLGYFVGKKGDKTHPQPAVTHTPQPQETQPPPQKQVIPDKKVAAQTPVQPSAPATEAKVTAPTPKEDKPDQKAIYTVQVGAFKDPKEAEALKNRLDGKGYKTYITESSTSKHVKLFRVRTGEFKGKKEAEVVALKLKKTEGLRAFVTLKN